MDWLNYHHLRYFWMVAKEGSLAKAAETLHVSQPSISEQIRELESMLGERLFQREGRRNRLTEAGQLAYRYADDIFNLGIELMNTVHQRPGAKMVRFNLGVADSFPKLITSKLLQPVFELTQTAHVVCREGKLDNLLGQLASHQLDLVLSDEPAPNNINLRAFSHGLGKTGCVICAEAKLAKTLKRGFPKSLDGAPALLPADDTTLRRELEKWFRTHEIKPDVIAEFDDLALMKVLAAEGRGFIPVPFAVLDEATERYGYKQIGKAENVELRFYAITAERKMIHPAASAITSNTLR